jgi:hypothetical protein
MNSKNFWLYLIGGFFLLKWFSSSSSAATYTTAPATVPIGVLPLVNGYFQGPAYNDSKIGMVITPYYFPNGAIAFLMDGAGVEYDFATGQPLQNPFPPLTAGE